MNSRQLEDLLALMDADTLTEAAARRNVTQPAFSRRVRSIEQTLGFDIIDRSRKPATLKPFIVARHEEFRTLALTLNRLVSDIRSASFSGSDQLLTIAATHSVAVTELPLAIQKTEATFPLATIRVRAGNLVECYGMLMTGQAEIMISYEPPQKPIQINDALIERTDLKVGIFLPVVSGTLSTDILRKLSQKKAVPLIRYPLDSFMGTAQAELLATHDLRFTVRAITNLSPAVLEMALSGLGIAWVMEAQAEKYIVSGQLCSLRDELPSTEFQLVMLRARGPHEPIKEAGWSAMKIALS